MKDSDSWILINIEQQPGRNGVVMSRLTFQNIDSNEIAEMTVDPTYTNYRKSGWDRVVQDECAWGIYEGLRLTKRTTREGLPVITADSPARIIYRCENHNEALDLAERSIAISNQRTNYHDLFGE
jgi:hypothetical protein